MARLTEQQKARIRELSARGKSQREIAIEIGCAQATVGNTLRGGTTLTAEEKASKAAYNKVYRQANSDKIRACKQKYYQKTKRK